MIGAFIQLIFVECVFLVRFLVGFVVPDTKPNQTTPRQPNQTKPTMNAMNAHYNKVNMQTVSLQYGILNAAILCSKISRIIMF